MKHILSYIRLQCAYLSWTNKPQHYNANQ